MSATPAQLSETPNADVVGAALLPGATYKAVAARAPWGVHVPARPRAAFYAVLEGHARLEVEGASDHVLSAHDVAFLTPEVPHTLRDASTSTTAPSARPFLAHEPGACAHVASPARLGGSGDATLFVSGWFELAPKMAEALRRADRVAVIRAGDPVVALLGLLRAELAAPQPATELLLRRLGDVLLVETLRDAMRTEALCASARALAEPAIQRALDLLHDGLATAWTVDALARRVGVSRSTFATRFAQVMGEPPLRYLARARLARAAQLLRETDASVAEIAERVGYDSAPAFSKAFKRARGAGPAAFRGRS